MAYRAYVGVQVHFTAEGKATPEVIVWEDGQTYEIDRIIDVRPAASRKVGGHGILYRVRIGRAETNLFREEDRWFVEAKGDREG